MLSRANVPLQTPASSPFHCLPSPTPVQVCPLPWPPTLSPASYPPLPSSLLLCSFKNGIQITLVSCLVLWWLPQISRRKCKLCIMAHKTQPLQPHPLCSFTKFQLPASPNPVCRMYQTASLLRASVLAPPPAWKALVPKLPLHCQSSTVRS